MVTLEELRETYERKMLKFTFGDVENKDELLIEIQVLEILILLKNKSLIKQKVKESDKLLEKLEIELQEKIKKLGDEKWQHYMN